MPEQGRLIRNTEQGMQQAAVADVEFGPPHEPLTEILEPRRQEPDHEGRRKHLEMAEHRLVGLSKRPAKLRRIEILAMMMRGHPPEPAE